jgi:hypothetical protein
MTNPKHIHRFLGVLTAAGLLGAGLLSGCGGEEPPLRPAAEGTAAASVVPDKGEPVLWTKIVGQWVAPGKTTVLRGSRYTLQFGPGSVAESTLVSISEHDEKIADVEFGPDGTQFKDDVLLEIDYSGTSSDPAALDFHGRMPALFYYDAARKVWEEIPAKVDPERKRITAFLRHFSRYSMYEPAQEGEWQWTQGGGLPPLRGGQGVSER